MASALYDEGHPLYEYFQGIPHSHMLLWRAREILMFSLRFLASADDRTRTIPGGLGSIAELDDEERARNLSLISQLSSWISVSVLRVVTLMVDSLNNKSEQQDAFCGFTTYRQTSLRGALQIYHYFIPPAIVFRRPDTARRPGPILSRRYL